MKFLSFKALCAAILLPPICYILTMEAIQRYYVRDRLSREVAAEIETRIFRDAQKLYDGAAKIEDEVRKAVRDFPDRRMLRLLGIDTKVAVVTKTGTIIYPPFPEQEDALLAMNHVEIAARNLSIMKTGLVIEVDTSLGYHTPLSIFILAVYMTVSLLMLYRRYRQGLRHQTEYERRKQAEIESLTRLRDDHAGQLTSLEDERARLVGEMERLREAVESEKEKALRSEDEMVDEIISLEEKIAENLAHQDEQKAELAALRDQLRQFEKEKEKSAKQRAKEANLVQKRFKTLYKNLAIHDRAVDGFTELPEEMKIKGEEIIHLLNEKPDQVNVKRKVFNKKGKETILEVLFAYKGRLYYRNTGDGRIEVLAVGTKNSQNKDLEFLNKIGNTG